MSRTIVSTHAGNTASTCYSGPMRTPVPSLPQLAQAFQARIDAAVASLSPADFPWYEYHILGGVTFLEALSAQSGLSIESMAAGQPLLDIGCADGHLAFFLESLGYTVTAVDHAPTSANDMKGVRALKQALGSAIDIIDTDLDRGFEPPRPSYGLVVLLGILYHLKNPFLMLETLEQAADYCLLSTRVARFTPSGTRIESEPVAYLLGEDEANHDPSNFWIFSEAGLLRLIARAGWDIRALVHSGNTKNSDPATAVGDERIYCLLSRRSLFTNGRLAEGWHKAEGPRDGWRWTGPRFAAAFHATPSSTGPRVIEMEIYLDRLRAVQLTASCNGRELATLAVSEPGVHRWRMALPGNTTSEPIRVEFSTTGDFATATDSRPLGIIVNRIHLL